MDDTIPLSQVHFLFTCLTCGRTAEQADFYPNPMCCDTIMRYSSMAGPPTTATMTDPVNQAVDEYQRFVRAAWERIGDSMRVSYSDIQASPLDSDSSINIEVPITTVEYDGSEIVDKIHNLRHKFIERYGIEPSCVFISGKEWFELQAAWETQRHEWTLGVFELAQNRILGMNIHLKEQPGISFGTVVDMDTWARRFESERLRKLKQKESDQ